MAKFPEGTKIEEREARLLGGILKKAGVNYVKHGIDVEELIEGKGNSTYEDLEVVLEEDPSTQMLATNLQQKLTSSKCYPKYAILLICVPACQRVGAQ